MLITITKIFFQSFNAFTKLCRCERSIVLGVKHAGKEC